MMRSSTAAIAAIVTVVAAGEARAFPHVVKGHETLAQIASRVYGDPKYETILVGANALDAQGGTVIVPGMRLEVPAPEHHTIVHGETWADLAADWLGTNDIARADLLARTNHSVPWVPPVEGQEIEIPPVVAYIAGEGETVNSIAQRFWGDPNRGEVVLVPLPHLKLTDAGKSEARAAAERQGASGGALLDQQQKADLELPQLLADVRYGRYVEALARGNRLLGSASLTHPQLATVHRALLEAYVAIDARPAAAAACAAWRANDPDGVLDPIRVSPKIRAACDAK
jgi:LysM repeat protein